MVPDLPTRARRISRYTTLVCLHHFLHPEWKTISCTLPILIKCLEHPEACSVWKLKQFCQVENLQLPGEVGLLYGFDAVMHDLVLREKLRKSYNLYFCRSASDPFELFKAATGKRLLRHLGAVVDIDDDLQAALKEVERPSEHPRAFRWSDDE